MLSSSWHPALPQVNPSTLPDVLAEHDVVLVHCWASWNNYDRQMDTLLLDLQQVYTGQVAFFSFDADLPEGHMLLHEWKVTNLPALVCFINGRCVQTLIGLRSLDELDTHLREWLLQ